MIRWFTPKDPAMFYRLIITAPDGRFPGEPLVGGITLSLAKYEAKWRSDAGLIVDIFKEKPILGLEKP